MTKPSRNGSDRLGDAPSGLFYSIADVAERFAVCSRTVRRWIEKKLLIATTVGSVVRIAEADLRAFIAAHRD